MKLAIIAASHPETKALKQHLKFEKTDESLYHLEKTDIYLIETGIGKKRVEKSLHRFFENHSPDSIINIGSAGAIDLTLPLYSIFVPNKLITETDTINCESELQKKIKNRLKKERILYSEGTLYTAQKPVCTEQERKRVKAQAVDMEAAYIQTIANKKNIPTVVIKIISDTPDLPHFKKQIKATGMKIREVMDVILRHWISTNISTEKSKINQPL